MSRNPKLKDRHGRHLEVSPDFLFAVRAGLIPGFSLVTKFGRNGDIDTATVPEDIAGQGGVLSMPTADRTHAIVSTSAQDAGTLRYTGKISSSSGENTINDPNADFVSDGVTAGDVVLIPEKDEHSLVVSVTDLNNLVIRPWHHIEDEVDRDYTGETYQIVGKAGTGIPVLHIVKAHKDEDAESYTEFVIMNGTTPVNTDGEYYRITRMHGHGAGSNDANVGTITATAAVDGTVSAQIDADAGQTQMAYDYIPYGYTAFVIEWHASVYRTGAAGDYMAEVRLQTRLWGSQADGVQLKDNAGIHVSKDADRDMQLLKVRQEEDIWLQVVSVSDNNGIVTGGFSYLLVENKYLH